MALVENYELYSLSRMNALLGWELWTYFLSLINAQCMVEIMDILLHLFKHRCMVENYGFSLSFINAWLLRIMDFLFRSLMHRCMVESYGYSLFHRCILILVWTCRSAICLPPLPVLESVILVWLEVAGTVRESDKEAVVTHCHTMHSLLLSAILPHRGFLWIMRVNRL